MPNARQLTWMRERFNRTLKDVCTIKGPSAEARDADGYVTTPDDGATIASNMKCSYHTATGKERLVAEGIAAAGDIVVTFESTAIGVVEANMKAVVAARSPFPEKIFNLTWVREDSEMVGCEAVATEAR